MKLNGERGAIRIVSYVSLDTSGSVGPTPCDTVPTHTYIHITGPCQSMVYTAADPGSACPRAGSPKYPFFFIFHQPKGCFPPDRQKVFELPYKKRFFFKGYESVNFSLRRARPGIRRPWTCSRSHKYMQHSNPQMHLLWS